MKPAALLSARRKQLEGVVLSSLHDASAHSEGFSRRVLGPAFFGTGEKATFVLSDAKDRITYGGYPGLAYVGFALGEMAREAVPDAVINSFLPALERLGGRAESKVRDFASDDVAVLGVSDGVRKLVAWRIEKVAEVGRWLRETTDRHVSDGSWSRRARDLAADLLDDRGRLRAGLQGSSLEEVALDLCLREAWPDAFLGVQPPDAAAREALLKMLLTEPGPEPGDLERASVWLKSLELLVKQAAQSLVTSTDDVVRLLENTQSALKRWVWEEKARRSGADPAKWAIDNEYHVQSLLWAVLYPVFGADLREEQYLPGHGLAQPRYDLAIVSLKLIVEVKFVRQRSDFKEVEEQIAGDLGIYFEESGRFDRLIAYVYDDCDTQYPELYAVLKNALKSRDERIVDVVIVRRPGMIPDRGLRSRA